MHRCCVRLLCIGIVLVHPLVWCAVLLFACQWLPARLLSITKDLIPDDDEGSHLFACSVNESDQDCVTC